MDSLNEPTLQEERYVKLEYGDEAETKCLIVQAQIEIRSYLACALLCAKYKNPTGFESSAATLQIADELNHVHHKLQDLKKRDLFGYRLHEYPCTYTCVQLIRFFGCLSTWEKKKEDPALRRPRVDDGIKALKVFETPECQQALNLLRHVPIEAPHLPHGSLEALLLAAASIPLDLDDATRPWLDDAIRPALACHGRSLFHLDGSSSSSSSLDVDDDVAKKIKHLLPSIFPQEKVSIRKFYKGVPLVPDNLIVVIVDDDSTSPSSSSSAASQQRRQVFPQHHQDDEDENDENDDDDEEGGKRKGPNNNTAASPSASQVRRQQQQERKKDFDDSLADLFKSKQQQQQQGNKFAPLRRPRKMISDHTHIVGPRPGVILPRSSGGGGNNNNNNNRNYLQSYGADLGVVSAIRFNENATATHNKSNNNNNNNNNEDDEEDEDEENQKGGANTSLRNFNKFQQQQRQQRQQQQRQNQNQNQNRFADFDDEFDNDDDDDVTDDSDNDNQNQQQHQRRRPQQQQQQQQNVNNNNAAGRAGDQQQQQQQQQKKQSKHVCSSQYHKKYGGTHNSSKTCKWCTVCHGLEILFNGCKKVCTQHKGVAKKVWAKLHLRRTGIYEDAEKRAGDYEANRDLPPKNIPL